MEEGFSTTTTQNMWEWSFSKLQKLKDAYVKQGQYYFEHLKFSSNPTSDWCKEEGWTGGIPIARSPLPALIRLRRESISQLMKPVWRQARLTVSFLVYKWRRCFLKRSWPLLHDNQAVRQACLKLNIGENTCRGYLQHLEFLALKEDKRNLQRNAIPADICWESIENVERLTNKQLKLYLRKEGLGARWCPETKHN